MPTTTPMPGNRSPAAVASDTQRLPTRTAAQPQHQTATTPNTKHNNRHLPHPTIRRNREPNRPRHPDRARGRRPDAARRGITPTNRLQPAITAVTVRARGRCRRRDPPREAAGPTARNSNHNLLHVPATAPVNKNKNHNNLNVTTVQWLCRRLRAGGPARRRGRCRRLGLHEPATATGSPDRTTARARPAWRLRPSSNASTTIRAAASAPHGQPRLRLPRHSLFQHDGRRSTCAASGVTQVASWARPPQTRRVSQSYRRWSARQHAVPDLPQSRPATTATPAPRTPVRDATAGPGNGQCRNAWVEFAPPLTRAPDACTSDILVPYLSIRPPTGGA